MFPVIDAHVHILPDRLSNTAISKVLPGERLEQARRLARNWASPIWGSLHRAQTFFRHLPEPLRRYADQIGGASMLPGLLVESTLHDLKEAMAKAGVDSAVIVAHPPFATSEFVLETCAKDPSLIPAVYVQSGTARPGIHLKKLATQGARFLKIHGPADGEGVDSPRYKALLHAAADTGLTVIIHTGCNYSHILFKDPEQGQAQRYAPWFKKYRQTQFILAHMNYHEPNVAMDLAEEHPNVLLNTSWQPAEVIGEAVRRLGPEKVLFASDWPLIGNNLFVGVSRVQDCVETGVFSAEDAQLVMGGNMARLLAAPKPEKRTREKKNAPDIRKTDRR